MTQDWKLISLEKLPGIYSARWAGPKSDFKIAIKKVYKELKKKNVNLEKKIKCRFICALTIYWPNKKYYQSQGIIEGTISSKPKGTSMDLVMILYLFPKVIKLLLAKCYFQKNQK